MTHNKEDGKFQSIHFASRTRIDAKYRHENSERESLAVVFALKKFLVFLLSSLPFKMVIDHNALSYKFMKKDINGRVAGWMDYLA